jgi:hypothetical protein
MGPTSGGFMMQAGRVQGSNSTHTRVALSNEEKRSVASRVSKFAKTAMTEAEDFAFWK